MIYFDQSEPYFDESAGAMAVSYTCSDLSCKWSLITLSPVTPVELTNESAEILGLHKASHEEESPNTGSPTLDWKGRNNMGEMTFTDSARFMVADYFNSRKDLETATLQVEEVYVVWFCYILGNWKALLSTTRPDNMYYEVTYNEAREVTFLDAYRKIENVEVDGDGRITSGTHIHN
jgi:hypothetical protein